MPHNRFQKYSGKYNCVICGKATRETGEGESSVDMCAKCYNEAGLENQHSDTDGKHDGVGYMEECPTCRANRADHKAGKHMAPVSDCVDCQLLQGDDVDIQFLLDDPNINPGSRWTNG